MSARRNAAVALLATLLLTAACQIHSPGQLELARTLLSRYTASFADSLAVTDSLPAEEERLLAAYRSNYKLISSTEELALLNGTWATFLPKVNLLNDDVTKLRTDRAAEQTNAKNAVELLDAVKKPLAAALADLNKGLKQADASPTLEDQLDFISKSVAGATTNIAAVQKALGAAMQAGDASGMSRLKLAAERLQPLAPKLETYFKSVVTGPTRAKGQNAPLAVEATRLARDILAIEVDILDQEISSQQDLSNLAAETLQALPPALEMTRLVAQATAFEAGADARQPFATTLRTLAQQGDSGENELRTILRLTGFWYYVRIQTSRAKDIHELKASILTYRQAKLLDLAYDRQRRTLISYGLLAAVRYAEGGWKSQDTANLISLIQTGLQAGLLAKI